MFIWSGYFWSDGCYILPLVCLREETGYFLTQSRVPLPALVALNWWGAYSVFLRVPPAPFAGIPWKCFIAEQFLCSLIHI